jgi:uncharacterized protein (TIGR02118 family)
VKRNAAALRARRYVQSHTLETEANTALQNSRGSSEPFDGITEVWWDSHEAFQTALDSPEGQKAARELLEDEGRFVDLSGSSLFLTREHTIFAS